MKKTILLYFFLVECTSSDGFTSRLKRYLLYNPADMSTAIGYKNHSIHDMTSLVNEASSQAHGPLASGLYNIPNFPGMGNNGVQSSTGGQSSSGNAPGSSLVSGSSSASFAGTNHWWCDSHVVSQCETQCLDIDPKDGCPFCIPGCTQKHLHVDTGSTSQLGSGEGTSGQPGSNSGNHPFGQLGNQLQTSISPVGVGSPFGTPASAPFSNQASSGLSQSVGTLTGSGSHVSLPGSAWQSSGTLTGTSGSNLVGGLGQAPPSLVGMGSQSQGYSGTACPFYPSNCPKIYTKLENGCLKCTLLAQLHLQPPTTTNMPLTSTLQPQKTHPAMTAAILTCAPTRCVAPCNKGIVLGPDGCPRCKCPMYA